jgi:multiple sugar transport system permease protein
MVLTYLTLAVVLTIVLLPISWVVLCSFKTEAQIRSMPPALLFEPTFSAYEQISHDIPSNFLNSIVICSSSVVLSLAIGIPAAYALSRIRFRGRNNVTFWIISTQMAPAFGFIVPFYIIYRDLSLLDTYQGLIIIYLTFNLPFVIWMMKGFFSEIPNALDEAALIDGCSRLGALVRIVLPVSVPAIAATLVLSFIFSWNEFLFAYVLSSQATRTVPVAIATRVAFMDIRWSQMAAIATISIIPIMILTALVQRHLVRGLTFGAMKG